MSKLSSIQLDQIVVDCKCNPGQIRDYYSFNSKIDRTGVKILLLGSLEDIHDACLRNIIPHDVMAISLVAARENSTEILDWLEKYDHPIWANSGIFAAANGRLDNIKWLYGKDGRFSHEIPHIAAKFGHFNILQFLHQHDLCTSSLCFDNYLLSNKSMTSEQIQFMLGTKHIIGLGSCAAVGDIDLFKYMYPKYDGKRVNYYHIIYNAEKEGQVEFLEFIRDELAGNPSTWGAKEVIQNKIDKLSKMDH